VNGRSEFDAVRQEEIRTIFLRVLEAAPEEREAVLEAGCGWDAALRREVEELLGAHEDADDVLWSLARRARAPLAQARSGFFAEGRRLGAYRLLRQIGQGGMGAVYLAERADGEFEKQVAVKLLPLGLSTGAARERFLAERQILAQLEHPGIARLLDAGIAEDGTPFFVLEYVEGEPIDRYCERRSLGIEGRIDLFLQVCAAVEYAHRNLVVHRDLKPGNILVTPEGVVKLLDFGIAKVLDAESAAGATALTQQAGRPMTPAYASPEQVRGEPITTATDVYALGVLLYQLLAGRTPYEVAGLSPGELERLICTQDPITPSAAAAGRAPESENIASTTSAAASRRARRLRGDLDTIVLMALRKEPERRYRSVSALADDLVRHREGRPVAARSDRFSYRAGKFMRRRPGTVAAGVAAAIILSGYGAIVAAHAERLEVERNFARAAAFRAEEERNRAEIERDRAESERARAERAQALAENERNRARSEYERAEAEAGHARIAQRLSGAAQRQAETDRDRAEMEAARAGQVTEFLVGLFETADPMHSPGSELSVRDVLDRGVERVDALAGQRDLHAELSLTMARVYHALGLYGDALPLIDRALAAHRDTIGQALSLAEALSEKAELLRHVGDHATSERLFRQALSIQRSVLGDEHPRVAESLNHIGVLLREMGDYEAAEPLYREALAIWRRVFGDEHPRVVSSLNNLGVLLRVKGDHDAAEPPLREALAMRRRLLGDEHPDVALSLNNLAVLLRVKGDYAAAEPLYREALAMNRRLLGDEHPDVAELLNNLSVLLHTMGDYAAAEPLYREALAMRRRFLGDEHPRVALSLNNLGALLRVKGDHDAAEPPLREALAMRRRLLGDEHPDVAQSLNNLGALLRVKGDHDAAEPPLREALAMRRRLLGDEHPSVAVSLESLGLLSRERGAYETAVSYLRDALDLRVRVLGEDHPAAATTRAHLEDVLGRMQAAEPR
jgi:eukaryotic-like serine/threonine-protein kinase